jgi:hypothetical protein
MHQQAQEKIIRAGAGLNKPVSVILLLLRQTKSLQGIISILTNQKKEIIASRFKYLSLDLETAKKPAYSFRNN